MATTAQEVESIVVRLTGDGSQYRQMMSQAQVGTKSLGKDFGTLQHEVDGFGRALSRFGEAAVAAVGLNYLRGLLNQAFDAFAEAEMIGLKLTATLEANGRQVDETREQYERFAATMEDLTTQEDDAILSMLAMAETFEVTGTAAQEAVRNATSLAAVTGGQAESYIRLTAALAKGDTEQAMRFARMVPQLRGIKDQTEFVTRATQLFASGQKAATAEMQSASGVLKLLHRDFGNMLEDVGKIIAEGLKPLVDFGRQAIATIRALDDQTKRFLTIILLTTTALLSVGPVISLFGTTGLPLLRMMGDAFQIVYFMIVSLFTPIKTLTALWGVLTAVMTPQLLLVYAAIGLVALGIGLFITRMGGIKPALTAVKDFAYRAWASISSFAIDAWEKTKTAVNTFLEWFRPIWLATAMLARTAWNLVVEYAGIAWDYIVVGAEATVVFLGNVWRRMFGDVQINWTSIRDFIRDTILFTEFTLLNLPQVARFVWAGIKLDAVVMANFLLNNAFTIITFGWNRVIEGFVGNWRIGIRDVLSASVAMTGVLIGVMTALNPAMAAQLTAMSATIRDTIAGLADSSLNLRGITVPGMDRLEAQLRAEWQALGVGLNQSWEAFRAQRLAEMNIRPEEIIAAERHGAELGNAINRGMGDPLKRLEGTLFGSMEAVSRVLEFQDRVGRPADRPTPRLGGESAEAVSPILRRIAMATERLAARPAIEVEGAGL